MSYPDDPGYSDDDTSKKAADAYRDHLAPSQERCIRAVQEAGKKGCTADEVDAALGLPVKTSGPRLSELVKAGRLWVNGTKRSGRSGRQQRVVVHPKWKSKR